MRAVYTQRFLDSYASSPPEIQRAADRRVALLLQDLRHPSLRAKKYDEARDLWQARATGSWRFYPDEREEKADEASRDRTRRVSDPQGQQHGMERQDELTRPAASWKEAPRPPRPRDPAGQALVSWANPRLPPPGGTGRP